MELLLNFFITPRFDEWWQYIILTIVIYILMRFICITLMVNVFSRSIHPEAATFIGAMLTWLVMQLLLLTTVGSYFYQGYGGYVYMFLNCASHLAMAFIASAMFILCRFRLGRLIA